MPDVKGVLRAKVEYQNFTGLKPAAELAETSAELYLKVIEANRIARDALLAEELKGDA